ncbi:serine/threonine protein kinase [Pendulispora brunnea]|uniref:Serine/threonine protein kinase n=1 Tax=Pendulispora brunnea TaxID=2905690 RepID=A0ABZ2JV09_9BACT
MAFPRPSSSERVLSRIGTTVRGYRIERLVGMGGMAAVYAATHPDGHQVALKFMLERFLDDAAVRELFVREAYLANQVGHPGAVPVLGQDFDDDGCAFLVMPLLRGETLRARWERAGKRLATGEVGVLVADALDVLASAHMRGLVHRDIKPENLFVLATGEIRVLDFGIARRVDGTGTASLVGSMIGTPAFMPPEQALGRIGDIGPHSDCWAVGATIFTLLSGEFVHAADSAPEQLAAAATRRARSLGEVSPNLPPSIARFVDKALAFDPEARWRTAREMRDALLEAFEDVLGKSVAAAAPDIRSAIATELLREVEATHVKATLRSEGEPAAPAKPKRAPERDLAGFECDVGDLLSAFRLMPAAVHTILAKHGLGEFASDGKFVPHPQTWWPVATYAAVTREVAAALGSTKTMELVKLVTQYHDLSTSVRDIHSALQDLDPAFRMRHRKDGKPLGDPAGPDEPLGHFQYRGEPGANLVAIESDYPYACDWERGCLFGIVRRFEPHSLVEHATGPCRKNGDDRCIYHITWW